MTVDNIQTWLENLLNEPFTAITADDPVYEINSRPGPESYSLMIACLQIGNIRPDVRVPSKATATIFSSKP